MQHATPTVGLIGNEVTVGTAASTNRESRRATNLFGESVRHLRQVVGVETEVIGHCASLPAGVANKLDIGGRAEIARTTQVIADRHQEVRHDGHGDLVELTMFATRRNQRRPGSGAINVAQGQKPRLPRRGIHARANGVKGALAQHASRDRRCISLCAVGTLFIAGP